MFVSTGNNFGAGQISFKDVQESNYVVLNTKFTCVPTSEEYQAAEQLEIYVPDLSIDRSTVSFATGLYTDRVPHSTYTTVHDGGTFLKTWIKDKNTIVIEKLPAFDGKNDLIIYIQALYPQLNAGANTIRCRKTKLRITQPTYYCSWDSDSICGIFDKWVFLHMQIDSISYSAETADMVANLENFPTDVDAEVPILMPDNGRQNVFGGVNKTFISNGVWTSPKEERCMGFYNTGSNNFMIAYLVRDGATE